MIKINPMYAIGKSMRSKGNSFLQQYQTENFQKMKCKTLLFLWLAFITVRSLAAPPVEEGKNIFSTRCAGCHNVHKTLTGPALAGVDQRRSMEWIIGFVHSSQSMIKKGDKDAVALFEKFNKIPMPDHADLTDENIKNIIAYIKTEAAAPAKAHKEVEAPKQAAVDYIGFSSGNYGLLLTYACLLVLLIGSLLFLVQVKALRRRMDQKQL